MSARREAMAARIDALLAGKLVRRTSRLDELIFDVAAATSSRRQPRCATMRNCASKC